MRRILLLAAALTTVSLPALAGPGSASGPITVDSTTYVPGSSVMGTDGGFYSSSPQPVGSGTTAAFGMTRFRSEHVNLRDSSGNEIGTSGNPLFTTASSTITIGNVTITNSSFSVTGSSVSIPNGVAINGTANVAVTNTPTVKMSSTSISGSSVTVTNGNVTATISGTPNVSVTNTPTVTVGSALPVGTNNIGTVTGSTVTVRTAAGNNLGTVVNNTVGTTINAALPAGTNQLGTVSGSSVTVMTSGGGNFPVALGAPLPAGSNVIGQITVLQAIANALKASVSIDGSSNTVVATQGGTPYTVNITKINGTSIAGSSVPVTGSFSVTLSSSSSGVVSYQGGLWNVGISTLPPVSITGTPSVNAIQSGVWNMNVTNTPAVTFSGIQPVTAKIDGSSNTVQVSGQVSVSAKIDGSSNTVTANQGGAPWSQNITQVNGNAISGSSVPVTGSLAVTQSSTTASVASYQAGTWTNTVTQGTNANLRASVAIDGSSNTVTASQGTNANLRASVAIDGSSNTVVLGGGTANIGKILYQTPTTAVLTSTGITTAVAISTPVAGLSSQTVRVFRLVVTADAATTINFRDGSTNFGEQYPLAANGSIVLDFSGEPWYVTSSSNGFVVKQSGSANLGIRIWYTQS